MKSWPAQDLKARFDELLDACLREGPQLVTGRGAAVAVLVPFEQWQRMNQATQPTLKELLLNDAARGELSIPPRRRWRRRAAAESS